MCRCLCFHFSPGGYTTGKGRYKTHPLPARPDPHLRVTRMAFGLGFSFLQQPPAIRRNEKKQAFAVRRLPTYGHCLLLLRFPARSSADASTSCASRCTRCGPALRSRRWRCSGALLYMEETASHGPGRGAQPSASTPVPPVPAPAVIIASSAPD